MLFSQHYLDCLSQASYVVADETSKQAVVVDPRRDVADYLAEAQEHGLTIVGVVNTHFHADFVSGHLELAERTGAWIGYGDNASPDFNFRPLADGEHIRLGDVDLEIMATPGHTPESISVLVREHADDEIPYGVLTGDALFIGDVGRPDLLASAGTTAEELARQLYRSVQHRLMGLPDAVRVFPAHGAGSACGKNLSTEKQSTIGEQRRTNYACRPMTEQEFVDVVTEGQAAAPAYFAFDAALNKQDRPTYAEDAPRPALSHEAVTKAVADGAVVLDTRPADEFAAGHLRGSVSVPVDGRTAETVGMLLAPTDRIVLVAPQGRESETATRLARIGYDHVVGYVADIESYLAAHEDRSRHASRVRVDQLDPASGARLLDVRGPGEVADGAMPGAATIPLPQLARRLDELDPGMPLVVYCAGGWRSSVAASFLRAKGFDDVSDVIGGYDAWAAAQLQAG